MNKKWHLTGGAAVLLAVAGGICAGWPSEGKTRRLQAANPELRPRQQQQSVGWVFGRLIGVPGAERPLMSQSGIGFRPPMPQTTGNN